VRRNRRGLPDDAEEIVEEHLAHWRWLDAGERERLLELSEWLLRRKHWEAARGFALDDRVRVVIAAQAALLILGLSPDHYRHVSAIVVHPSTTLHRGERAGPAVGTRTDALLPVHGLAQDRRGPVVIAWDQALAGARDPERGHNVVLHEFAHKIDMLDGLVDGTPPLPRADVAEWVRICTAVFEGLRSGEARPPLRTYGAVNPGEFFAVATEAFFDRPHELLAAEPDLYGVLAAFYRQDPARRVPPPPVEQPAGEADGGARD
jgi:Mlc titration factor MtfA (ptsG expression regulator)